MTIYIEKDIVDNINNESIIQQFQNMKNLYNEILELYVFVTFFFYVNIFKIYFYEILFNLNFLMTTLNKISEAATA